MFPGLSRYCPECDHPDFCGGEFCVKDLVLSDNSDSELRQGELQEELPAPTNLSEKTKEFITTIISRAWTHS